MDHNRKLLVHNIGNARHYETDQDESFKNRSQVSDITVDWSLINKLIINRKKITNGFSVTNWYLFPSFSITNNLLTGTA
jgi:hypothetical protein